MMTQQEAEAIYDAGKETVVRVLLELSRKVDQLTADFAALKAENAALRAECQTLRAECQALRNRVRTLEEQVAKDSHNSHKPPSSDGLAKPKPKSLRPPSQRPTGGQPGHPGSTLRMVEKPDRTLRHTVERCAGCGRSLVNQKPERVERRQVFDLPEPKLEVTEHQVEVKTCACGCVNRAAFPPEAAAPVQYGPRVKSVAVYLDECQLLPFDRLTEIMRDLFACETFSEGTLANFKADCSRRLAPVEEAIRDLAAAAPVAGFDETGARAVGSLHWLHTVSTRLLTWYYAHKRRGSEAMDAAGILADYHGIAVHDFLKAGYEQNPVAPALGPKRRGRLKQSKARNLLDRFRDHHAEILAFMRDFAVPFDNNQSERDPRMMKPRRKISGTFRNFQALLNFCRIRGYVSTARKNGINALDALQRVFLGHPFVPEMNTS